MADSADAITNGIEESTIKLNNRGNCWFHVKSNIDSKIQIIKDKSIKNEIITEIVCLQLSQTPKIFHSAAKLLVNKWLTNETRRRDHFHRIIYFSKIKSTDR